ETDCHEGGVPAPHVRVQAWRCGGHGAQVVATQEVGGARRGLRGGEPWMCHCSILRCRALTRPLCGGCSQRAIRVSAGTSSGVFRPAAVTGDICPGPLWRCLRRALWRCLPRARAMSTLGAMTAVTSLPKPAALITGASRGLGAAIAREL